MKPRTKLQVRVKALSDALPPLTDAQEQYAFKHCLKHVAYRTKNQTACLDCGHVWASEDNTTLLAKLVDTHVVCPACGVRLTVEDTRKKKLYQRQVHISLLDVREEFQVVRIFQVWGHYRVGEVPSRHIWEVIQQFFVPDGKIQIVARIIAQGCYDSFCGDMEVRNPSNGWYGFKYDVWAKMMFPKPKVLPIYNRNGFVCKVDDVSAWELCKKLTFDSKTETLLKAKQLSLLTCRVSSNESHRIQKHWDSIKICMRNKYVVKPDEDITYLDYLDLLEYFKKDLRSVKYCCPKDLKKVHNQLVAKKTEIEDRKRYTGWLSKEGKDINTLKNMSVAALRAEYERIQAEKTEIENRRRYAKRIAELRKDSGNLKNMSAADLKVQLDKIMAEIAEEARQAKLAKQIQEAAEEEANYKAAKGAYFGIVISDGPLTIKVLESVHEFIAEAEAHGHCVFTNGYYKKADSLVFSAQIDGKPAETIEISLSQMKVVQARGLGNNITKYHDQIVELVQKNMRLIKKAAQLPKNNQVAA